MLTIKELRIKEAARLAARKNPNPTPADLEAAAHTMRIFYRFASAYLNSFYISNNRNSSPAAVSEADEKSEKAYKRAAEALKAYNIKISLPGLYSILDDSNGCNFSYCHYYK